MKMVPSKMVSKIAEYESRASKWLYSRKRFTTAFEDEDDDEDVQMEEQDAEMMPQRELVFQEGVVSDYARQFEEDRVRASIAEAERIRADPNWDGIDPGLPVPPAMPWY